MSSSTKIDNRKRDIFLFGEGPTQGSDERSLTAEEMYSISFAKNYTKSCLSLH